MEVILFFILGITITLLMVQKPIKFEVKHTYETLHPELKDIDMSELEEKMLKEDPKNDQLYEDFEKTLQEVNEIMGGSDR